MWRSIGIGALAAVCGAVSASASPALATAPARTIELPILTYHRIDALEPNLPPTTRRLTVAPEDFRRQMRWLVRRGFTTVTQRQLLAALRGERPLPRKPVMITFDDGYRDVFANALPILESLGLRATAYVITDRISNGDPSFLTWDRLRALQARGVEIGSHTATHADLTTMTDQRALDELLRSRRALEEKLGHPVPWLAYPFGAHDARVVKLARRAGYALAVTTVHGVQHDASRPLELRRLRVLDSTGVAGLAALLARGASA
jgi:peptidoglycan/xylan/chitin deacetylase (PgdA/CDA1 family)